MVKNNLGFFDYLKAAFSWPVYVSGLGRMPLNYLILAGFAILGLGNPGFWLLGLAYEVGYLLFMAGSNRFQKLVQGDLLLKQRKIWKEKTEQSVHQPGWGFPAALC